MTGIVSPQATMLVEDFTPRKKRSPQIDQAPSNVLEKAEQGQLDAHPAIRRGSQSSCCSASNTGRVILETARGGCWINLASSAFRPCHCQKPAGTEQPSVSAAWVHRLSRMEADRSCCQAYRQGRDRVRTPRKLDVWPGRQIIRRYPVRWAERASDRTSDLCQ